MEFAADVIPLETLLNVSKQSCLCRFAIYPVAKGSSQDPSPRALPNTDLTLHVSGINGTTDHNDMPRISAIYNQRIFSSARIQFVLAQLLQMIENSSLDSNELIGGIEIMTDAQRTLLPDPKKDLHW